VGRCEVGKNFLEGIVQNKAPKRNIWKKSEKKTLKGTDIEKKFLLGKIAQSVGS